MVILSISLSWKACVENNSSRTGILFSPCGVNKPLHYILNCSSVTDEGNFLRGIVDYRMILSRQISLLISCSWS